MSHLNKVWHWDTMSHLCGTVGSNERKTARLDANYWLWKLLSQLESEVWSGFSWFFVRTKKEPESYPVSQALTQAPRGKQIFQPPIKADTAMAHATITRIAVSEIVKEISSFLIILPFLIPCFWNLLRYIRLMVQPLMKADTVIAQATVTRMTISGKVKEMFSFLIIFSFPYILSFVFVFLRFFDFLNCLCFHVPPPDFVQTVLCGFRLIIPGSFYLSYTSYNFFRKIFKA